MAKDPELRLDTATAVMDELAAAIGGTQLAPPPPRPARTATRPTSAPTRSAATTGFGTPPAARVSGPTVIDRPPTASKVGPRPVIKRSYRKPILITLAVILVAAASSAGFLLSDRGPTEAQQAHTAYLAAVDKVVNTLAEQQQSGRETLAAADEQREQIEATGGLANTYEATGDDLDALKVPVADAARHKQLVALVDKAQSQYATMRQAAETNDKPTYDATTAEVVATENDLNKLIAALRGAAVPVSAARTVLRGPRPHRHRPRARPHCRDRVRRHPRRVRGRP